MEGHHPFHYIDYSYLRPPGPLILLNKPTESQIGFEGERKRYYECPPTEKEQETIDSFKVKWKEVMEKREPEERMEIPDYWF